MLSTLMAAARAKSAAFICMIHDDNNELEIDNDDDVDDDNNDDFMELEDWFGLALPPVVAAITNNNHVPPRCSKVYKGKSPSYEPIREHVVDKILGTGSEGRPD